MPAYTVSVWNKLQTDVTKCQSFGAGIYFVLKQAVPDLWINHGAGIMLN